MGARSLVNARWWGGSYKRPTPEPSPLPAVAEWRSRFAPDHDSLVELQRWFDEQKTVADFFAPLGAGMLAVRRRSGFP